MRLVMENTGNIFTNKSDQGEVAKLAICIMNKTIHEILPTQVNWFRQSYRVQTIKSAVLRIYILQTLNGILKTDSLMKTANRNCKNLELDEKFERTTICRAVNRQMVGKSETSSKSTPKHVKRIT